MKIGISTASFFSKYTTEDSFEIIRDLGVDICEVFLTTFCEYEKGFSDLLLTKVNGIEVFSIHTLNQHFEPELFNGVFRTRNDAEIIFKKIAVSAKILNAKYYTFHGPARLKRTPYILNFPWIAERLQYLNKVLSDYTDGLCQLAYENVHWTYFSNPGFFINLKQVSPVKCCLDIKQAMQSNYDIYDYVEIMKDRLVNVHLCDFVQSGELKIPGEGNFNFVKFFLKLIEIKYNGPLMLELYAKNFDNYNKLNRCIGFLRKCLTEAQIMSKEHVSSQSLTTYI